MEGFLDRHPVDAEISDLDETSGSPIYGFLYFEVCPWQLWEGIQFTRNPLRWYIYIYKYITMGIFSCDLHICEYIVYMHIFDHATGSIFWWWTFVPTKAWLHWNMIRKTPSRMSSGLWSTPVAKLKFRFFFAKEDSCKKRLNVLLVFAQAIIPSTSPERPTKKLARSVWKGRNTAGWKRCSTWQLWRNLCLVLQIAIFHILELKNWPYGNLMSCCELKMESLFDLRKERSETWRPISSKALTYWTVWGMH